MRSWQNSPNKLFVIIQATRYPGWPFSGKKLREKIRASGELFDRYGV